MNWRKNQQQQKNQIPILRPAYWLCGARHKGGMTFTQAVIRNMGSWMPMIRERHKMRTIEAESIEVASSGGLGSSSDEASVMEVERRAGGICLRRTDNRRSGRNYLA
jgi:hypothetical protein